MLEFLILYNLAKKIGGIIAEKGRKKTGYQVLLVALWFGGEIIGGIIGMIIGSLVLDSDGPAELLAYAFALAGAIAGAVFAFAIAKAVEPLVVEETLPQNIEYVERLGARERFGDRKPAPPVIDGYTDGVEKAQRPLDDRIQG